MFTKDEEYSAAQNALDQQFKREVAEALGRFLDQLNTGAHQMNNFDDSKIWSIFLLTCQHSRENYNKGCWEVALQFHGEEAFCKESI